MPRECSVCKHPKVDEINQALIHNGTLRPIALQYGLSHMALQRHKKDHLPAAALAERAALVVVQKATLFDKMENLLERSLALLDAAEAKGSLPMSCAAQKEVRANIQTLHTMMAAAGRQANPFTDSIIENYRQRKAAAGPMVRRTQLKPYVPEETEAEQAEDALQPSPWEESKDPPAPPAEAAPPATIRQRDLAAEQQQYLRDREDEEG